MIDDSSEEETKRFSCVCLMTSSGTRNTDYLCALFRGTQVIIRIGNITSHNIELNESVDVMRWVGSVDSHSSWCTLRSNEQSWWHDFQLIVSWWFVVIAFECWLFQSYSNVHWSGISNRNSNTTQKQLFVRKKKSNQQSVHNVFVFRSFHCDVSMD